MDARQPSTLSLLSLVNPRRSEGYFSTLAAKDHEYFGGVCEAYGIEFRSVFLKAFQETFIRAATKQELAVLRNAISARAKAKEKGRKRGRPPGFNNRAFLLRAGFIAWERYVAHQKWSEIAKALGLNQDQLKAHTWTMKRQLRILSKHLCENGETDRFIEMVSNKRFFRELLKRETGLPFIAHPEDCITIAVKLTQLTPKKQTQH